NAACFPTGLRPTIASPAGELSAGVEGLGGRGSLAAGPGGPSSRGVGEGEGPAQAARGAAASTWLFGGVAWPWLRAGCGDPPPPPSGPWPSPVAVAPGPAPAAQMPAGKANLFGKARKEEELRRRDYLFETYYCNSHQYPLTLLALVIIVGICLALIAIFYIRGMRVWENLAFIVTVFVALGVFLTTLVLVCVEPVFRKCMRAFSFFIWACLVAMGYVFIFEGGVISPWDQVSFFLFITFISYTMLPLCMRDAIIASLLSSISHIVSLSVFLSLSERPQLQLPHQLLANAVVFVCGNLVGAYHKHLMDRALQKTFKDTLNCIKSQMKLESEKKQQ
ncbi:adenylate cyclase type 2-like, partial [Mustelus asterias]